MLRMSFMEHLEELRSRILRALGGIGIAFIISLTFCGELWKLVQAPAEEALRSLKVDTKLTLITPMEAFNIVWVKLPILTAIFIASPWILYQVWGFIAPGLYKKGAAVGGPVCHLLRGFVYRRRRVRLFRGISLRFNVSAKPGRDEQRYAHGFR